MIVSGTTREHVSEYTIFVNNTKHGSVLEALQKLTQAKEDNIRKLEEKDNEYLELRRQFGGRSKLHGERDIYADCRRNGEVHGRCTAGGAVHV